MSMNYHVSRNLEYALMALSYMSLKKKNRVSVREMTERLGCPFDPFSRVMQGLASAGWVFSQKGVGGGYCLAKPLENLSLYDLMNVVLNQLEIAGCISGRCDLSIHCNIQTPIKKLNQKFMDFYKSVDITELLNLKKKKQSHRKKSLL